MQSNSLSGAQGAASDIHQKYITFSLGEEDYGIPVLQVLEIVKIENLIQLPHSRDYFVGLMDIRGTVLPVINLRKKLGIHMDAGDNQAERAVIIQAGNKRIGLAVDRVSHVHDFPTDSIDAGPATIKSASNRFITGVGKIKDHFVILLNLENLFTVEELAGLSAG